MLKKLILIAIITMAFSTVQYAQNFYLGVNNGTQQGCITCHPNQVALWQQTGHATAHDSMAAVPSYKGYCLPCHNTGWDLNAVNYGADEYVTVNPNQTWLIADQTNFDRVKNVQCESCHGPKGTSGRTIDFSHMTTPNDYSAENCGKCHEGTHHPYLSNWQQSAHASGTPASLQNRATRGKCFKCHYAQDFIEYLANPTYDYTNFVPNGELEIITCVTCHDPHGNGNPGNLRVSQQGQIVCDVCHTTGITDSVNVNSNPTHNTSDAYSGSPFFGYQYAGQTYQNSTHTYLQERCVTCHVHTSPYISETQPAVTGHQFEPRTEACEECHTDYLATVDTSNHEKRFDYRGTQTVIKGLLTTLKAELEVANSADSLTFEFKAANYNYKAATNEGSFGIHNTKLVKKLLEDAIANFTPTSMIEVESELPTQFSLSQNYPNPFNPSTTIKFTIPKASNVRLIIYDALGKVVNTLVDQQMSSGVYNVTWNAGNNASGIYFFKIEADNFVSTRKMMLIK